MRLHNNKKHSIVAICHTIVRTITKVEKETSKINNIGNQAPMNRFSLFPHITIPESISFHSICYMKSMNSCTPKLKMLENVTFHLV